MCRKLILLVLVLGFGLTVGVVGASEIKINFQSSGAPIPEGICPNMANPLLSTTTAGATGGTKT